MIQRSVSSLSNQTIWGQYVSYSKDPELLTSMCVRTEERAAMNKQPRGCPVYLSDFPSFRALLRIKVKPVPVLWPLEQRMLSHGSGEGPSLAIKWGGLGLWYGGDCFSWRRCGSFPSNGTTGGPNNQSLYHTSRCRPHPWHLEYFITDLWGMEEWKWLWVLNLILQFYVKLKHRVTSPDSRIREDKKMMKFWIRWQKFFYKFNITKA